MICKALFWTFWYEFTHAFVEIDYEEQHDYVTEKCK